MRLPSIPALARALALELELVLARALLTFWRIYSGAIALALELFLPFFAPVLAFALLLVSNVCFLVPWRFYSFTINFFKIVARLNA